MSYAKVQIANLAPGEASVQLDSGEYVAISVQPAVLPSGALAVKGVARWITGTGDPVVYGGSTVESSYSHTCGPVDEQMYGGADGVAKQVAMAMLGEPCAFFDDPTGGDAHAQAKADASIRTNINSHKQAQTISASGIL